VRHREQAIRDSGFEIERCQHFEYAPGFLQRLGGPHILGVARKALMQGHGKHIAICVGLIAVAAGAAVAGFGALKVLAGAGCMLMMGMMVWMMVRGVRS
jgi:hypothetical protein